MLTLGQIISAEKFYAFGGVDHLFREENSLEVAKAFVSNLPIRPMAVSQREVEITDVDLLAKTEAKLKAASKGDLASLANLDALKLATLCAFTEGQPQERERHLAMRDSAESRALRHAFLAERQVTKPTLIKGTTAKKISNVTVVGGGLMGAGITFSTLLAGYDVTLIERDIEAIQAARQKLEGMMDGAIKRGKLTSEKADLLMSTVTFTTSYGDAKDADLAIEAVFEDLGVKKEVFKSLATVVRDDAILATNTSYLDPHLIMEGLTNPERMMGLHFFSPAHIMKLVEVITLESTDPDIITTGFSFAKSLGKTGVMSRVCDGFIGNRILAAYRRQADYLLMDGATPEQIDRAMRQFGFNMGPYEMQDMAGLQIAWANRKRLAPIRPKTERYVEIGDKLCESERFGQRSGKGWYRYESGDRTPITDQDVISLIETLAREKGITRQAFSDEEICLRLLAVMANEGALILEEGIAERALDIDIVKILGYGFPGGGVGRCNTLPRLAGTKLLRL